MDHTYAAPQEKKTSSPKQSKIERKRKRDRRLQKTRVNVGEAFSRWKELMLDKDFKRDAEEASFLLDR